MNAPVRRLSLVVAVLFASLLVSTTLIQYVFAADLNARPDNRRTLLSTFARERGEILVGQTAVAKSVPVDDEYKYQRVYDEGKLYAHVTGSYSFFGASGGLEQAENSLLSGSSDKLFYRRVSDLFTGRRAQGANVETTLDPLVQAAAADGLKGIKGAAVALDPKTGAILADVSIPSYNPNVLAGHDFQQVKTAYETLNANGAPRLISRSTQSIYPPGSTFKLVTAATALSNGYTPDTMVRGGTELQLPQTSHVLHNENGSDCGGDQITLTQALVVSCNVSFGDLGLKLGADRLRDQAEKFGFNEDYLTQLPFNPSVFPESLDEPQTALSAIGQFDVAASPLQMAMVAAGIANGGAVMTPYVVAEVRSPDLDVLSKAQPEVLHQAISGQVADELTQMMVDVVNSGTGSPAQIPGVSVAGKTGTANSATSKAPYAWMVTFAPANDPQVAVAVAIEQSGEDREDITGGGLAGPIARAVMEAVINP